MKTSIYFIAFILLSISSFGQSRPGIDSLVNKGKRLLDSDLNESLKYSYQAFEMSKKEGYYWGQMNAAQWIAEAYYYQSNTDSALVYDEIALKLSRAENDLPEIANNLVAMGQKLGDRGEISEAIQCFNEAEEIMIGRKDTFDLADLYLRKGSLYIDIDEHDLATEFLNKSLEYNRILKDTLNQAYAIGNMGIVQKKIGNIEKAIELTNDALTIYRQQNQSYSMAAALVNIGILKKDLKQYDEAVKLYNEAIEIAKEVDYAPLTLGIHTNLGILYNILGEYSKAKKVLLVSTSLAKSLQNKIGLSDAQSQLAKAEYYLGNGTASENLLKESIENAQTGRSFEKLKEAHQIGYEIAKNEKNFTQLSFHAEQLQVAKDSLYNAQKAKQVNSFQIKYETAKKDAEIELLNKQAELDSAKRTGLIAGLVLLAITAGAIVFSLVQKRRKDQQIHQQEKEIEKVKLQKAQQELEFKQKELTAKVLQLARKNEFLGSLENEIEELKSNVDEKVKRTSTRIVKLIKRDTSDDKEWDQFSSEFSSVHQGFFEKLQSKHGSFTQSETRLISLLKMNLSSKDIADILRISDEGIKKARYRLRKKLNLQSDDDLQGYLSNIG